MVQKKKTPKAAPFPSHEFFIQNHGDIVVTIMTLFFIGLVFQPTHTAASRVLFLNYNISTENLTTLSAERVHSYTYFVSGPFDWFNIVYYSMGCIVAHAMLQEYILDKVVKKSHLSKSKLSKFNESAHLSIFYLASIACAAYVCYIEKYPAKLSFLWDDYPHVHHMLLEKLFFIIQISYWIHIFPEFYFQKVRKEDIPQQITYSSLYLLFLVGGYFMNFSRVLLLLICVHYACETVFHIARMIKICDNLQVARIVFFIWGVLFVVARLFTFSLCSYTFWVGLQKSQLEAIDVKNGNFNTPLVRTICLASVVLLQSWLMWNFVQFQLKFFRDTQLGKSASRDSGLFESSDEENEQQVKQDKPRKTVPVSNGNADRLRQRPVAATSRK